MKYKYEYHSIEERETIISQNQDKELAEEQNLFEGNFLIFEDLQPQTIEMNKLKEKSINTEKAIAETSSLLEQVIELLTDAEVI